jgi:hypothetical protein
MTNLLLLAILIALVGLGTVVSWVLGITILFLGLGVFAHFADEVAASRRRRKERQIERERCALMYPNESEIQRVRRAFGYTTGQDATRER